MPEWRLRNAEKEFLQQIMDRTVFNVQMRDMRLCCEHACRVILADQKMLKLATATLRPLVLDRIKCAGNTYFKSLFKRHGPYIVLPKPLRGKALHIRGSELGLVTREETVKVNVATIKDECKLAGGRKQMKMEDDIGRDCERALVHKKKRRCGYFTCMAGVLRLPRDNAKSSFEGYSCCVQHKNCIRDGYARTNVFVPIPHLPTRHRLTDEVVHICHQHGRRQLHLRQ
jgi:hypothetical protein